MDDQPKLRDASLERRAHLRASRHQHHNTWTPTFTISYQQPQPQLPLISVGSRSEHKPTMPPTYAPSPQDILHVSALLALKSLPPELISLIIEDAEYWARIATTYGPLLADLDSNIAASGSGTEHCCLLIAKPISTAAAYDAGCYVSNTNPLLDDGGDRVVESMNSPANSSTNSLTNSLTGGVIARTLDRVKSSAKALVGRTGLASESDGSEASKTQCMGSRARYYSSLPLTSIPEPRLKYPVRRITWRIRSHDQGWGGEGGDVYENSWTGFRGTVTRMNPETGAEVKTGISNDGEPKKVETTPIAKAVEDQTQWDDASSEDYFEPEWTERCIPIEPKQPEVWPQGDWCFKDTQIQLNRRADVEWMTHRIVWDYRDDIKENDPRSLGELKRQGRGLQTGDGSQVRALCKGDVVELWSYAFFPGWLNFVREAEFVIEFAL